MLQSRVLLFGVLVLAGLVATPARSAAQSVAVIQRADRLEFFVPPGGGAVEVPIHPWELCVLSFSEDMSERTLESVTDFVLEPWSKNRRQIGVRAKVDPASSGQTGSFALTSLRNRGTAPFRISRLELTRAGTPLPVEVKLVSAAVDKDPEMIGVVLPEERCAAWSCCRTRPLT